MENTQTLKSGTCPKCGGNEVYTTHGSMKRGERMILPITGWKRFFLDTYICLACGHFEEYVNDDDIKDANMKEGIKKELKKV